MSDNSDVLRASAASFLALAVRVREDGQQAYSEFLIERANQLFAQAEALAASFPPTRAGAKSSVSSTNGVALA